MSIAAVTWVSQGWSGAPGYTTFYTTNVDEPALSDFLDATHDFLQAIYLNIPSVITYTPPSAARVIAEVTGALIDIVPFDTPSTNVTGGAGTGFSAPSGFSVNWLTTTAGPHRLMVGRTFIVPLDVNSYQPDGTLATTALTSFQNAAAALVTRTAGSMVVWRRPVSSSGGAIGTVVAAKVNDRAAVLRTRRS